MPVTKGTLALGVLGDGIDDGSISSKPNTGAFVTTPDEPPLPACPSTLENPIDWSAITVRLPVAEGNSCPPDAISIPPVSATSCTDAGKTALVFVNPPSGAT